MNGHSLALYKLNNVLPNFEKYLDCPISNSNNSYIAMGIDKGS